MSTKDRLIGRGATINGDYELCSRVQESIDYLFARCKFTKWVLEQSMEATDALVKLGTATNFEEEATELNKMTPGSPAWGL